MPYNKSLTCASALTRLPTRFSACAGTRRERPVGRWVSGGPGGSGRAQPGPLRDWPHPVASYPGRHAHCGGPLESPQVGGGYNDLCLLERMPPVPGRRRPGARRRAAAVPAACACVGVECPSLPVRVDFPIKNVTSKPNANSPSAARPRSPGPIMAACSDGFGREIIGANTMP